MANIMINKVCNLQCPYCFANKFVNQKNCKDENNITIENFMQALNFATYRNNQCKIGIIGGEPTIHPDFEKLVKIAADDNRVGEVVVFSNGIHIDKCFSVLDNPKISVLINLNSPSDIGIENFNKIIDNAKNIENSKISFGVNIYDPKKDYSFALKACTEKKLNKIRISVVVPNTNDKRNVNSLEYFQQFKNVLFAFLKQCKEYDIMPYYDCNNFPTCLWNQEEYNWIETYVNDFKERTGYYSNLLSLPICEPVIDILPDLTAVRCFGCSDINAPITDFVNIFDLRNFFKNINDNMSIVVADNNSKCKNCYDRATSKCYGGCIAFKRNKINIVNSIIANFNDVN